MLIGSGNINYIQLPIKDDDDDVRLMFHIVAQIPPLNTIEMYLQTRQRDHSSRLSPSFHYEIMGHDVEVSTKGNLAQNDEMGGNLAVVTQSVIIATNNYVDIPFTNENDDVGMRTRLMRIIMMMNLQQIRLL